MKCLILIIFIWFSGLFYQINCTSSIKATVFYLQPESVINHKSESTIGIFSSDLRIYCYNGQDRLFSRYFQTAAIKIEIDSDDFVQYVSGTPETVYNDYQNERSFFSNGIFGSYKKKNIDINPFNQTCVGLETDHPYTIRLDVVPVDVIRLSLFVIALIFFFTAKRLSETPVFYYTVGTAAGMFASFLVAIYFISKLFPRKSIMYGVMFSGWAITMYFAQTVWNYMTAFIITNSTYVFYYAVITGTISFIVCYRFGPPNNQRSKDIMKWILQLLAVSGIYYSSSYTEASIAICFLVIIYYYLPDTFRPSLNFLRMGNQPPKRKLISQEEYQKQGVVETAKALDELRRYCSSPEGKPWETITKLKNPLRFAEFMRGSPHLSNDEIACYESPDDSESDSNISDDDCDPPNSRYSSYCKTPSINGFRSNRSDPLDKLNVPSNSNSFMYRNRR